MADERRLEIRERAGLEEARLNQDFIDFLRKFSTPVLLIVALLAVGWAVYQRRTQSKQAELSAAFAELEAARSGANPNPDTLVTIADTYASSGAVPILARLEAADIFMDAVRRGALPGAEVGVDGVVKPEDLLTEATRTETLAKAKSQFEAALSLAKASEAYSTHKLSALYGLAAVAESAGNWDEAKAMYEQVSTVAQANGFASDVAIAADRLTSLPELAKLAALPKREQVPTVLDTTPKPPETPALPQAGLDLGAAAPANPTPSSPAVPASGPSEPATAPTSPAPTTPAPTTPAPATPSPTPPSETPTQPAPVPGEPKKPE